MPPRKKHLKLMLLLLTVVFGMLLFAFALVPLYDTFCEMTGINDKGGRVKVDIPTEIDTSRTVNIKLITHVNSEIPFGFHAQEAIITVHPGQVNKAIFYLHNPSEQAVSGTFVATISPGLAARYVKKTECFSYDPQHMSPFEDKEMAVVFFIDKDLPQEIKELTLFYSLFDNIDSGANG